MTLPPGDEDLIRVASLARARAYAPYSKYKVGAAIRTKRNKIHSGANVENVSYGLTVCAERCAAFAAIASGETKGWDAIAVVIDDDKRAAQGYDLGGAATRCVPARSPSAMMTRRLFA